MKRLLPLFVAASFSASADAQVSIGNRIGLSISHQESTDEPFLRNQGASGQTTLMGLSSAIVIESKIKPFIAAQVELGVTQKGRQLSESKLKDFYRLKLNYGEGQFLAKGIIGKGTTKLNILAGISFGRGLVAAEIGEFEETDSIFVAGFVSGTINNGADSMVIFQDTAFTRTRNYQDRAIAFNEDRDNGLAITEWSLVGGLGASFDLGRSRVFIEGRYVQGLTPVYNGQLNEPDVFNRSILIQFGYLVQLNDPKSKVPVKPEAPQY